MKYFAVTGRPILHSKSPQLFSAWLRSSGIDAAYNRLQAVDAAAALAQFRSLGLYGMNVTAPFKESIVPLLDELTPEARDIGAVNTVLNRRNGIIAGDNTDHIGVVNALRKHGFALPGKKCLVLGAGGAGRAAAYGLVRGGAAVILLNRTFARARCAAATIGCQAASLKDFKKMLPETDLLLSTLADEVTDQLDLPLHPGLWVFTADYRSASLADRAEAKGCHVLRGGEWLIEQARAAFDLFFPKKQGITLPIPDISALIDISKKSFNIALIGFMGSGKTTVGRQLAQKLGLDFCDCDTEIEKTAAKTVEVIFNQEGEIGFRRREAEVMAVLARRRGIVMACGGGVVLTPANLEIVRNNFLTVWLTVSPRICLSRINGSDRPLLAAGDSQAKAQQLLAKRFSLYFKAADLLVDGENTVEKIVHEINNEICQLNAH